MNRGNVYKLRMKQLLFLKVNSFNPQIIAPMETKLDVGIMDKIHEIVDVGAAIESKLNVELCNAVEHNISRGQVASISNGWNNERFTFIMVVEVYDGTTLIAEEIYQGYTDRADTTMGSIENGGQVRLDPNTIMYVNKVMVISYRTDMFGNRTPVLHKPSNVYVNNANPTIHNSGLVLNRPSDIIMKYYTHEISGVSEGAMEVRSDVSNYNGTAKLSKTSNESAGTIVTSLIKAADKAKKQTQYTYSSDTLSNYEGMLDDQPDSSISEYYTLRTIGDKFSRIAVSNFTVGEIDKVFNGNVSPHVSSLFAYNDIITRKTNQVFNFNGMTDRGESTANDNILTRFQKKITPFIFDKMLSYGFITFSGVLTNRTTDGRISITHSVLQNISETVNTNTMMYNNLMRLLYQSLTSPEATRLISGGTISRHDIDMVFDFDIYSSSLRIIIDGNEAVFRIPSMADSTYSSIISTENDSIRLGTELKSVVDNVLTVTNNEMYNNKSIWE